MDFFDISGKTAIITGGAGDLGAPMTRALCQAGVSVCIISHSGAGDALAGELTDLGYKAFCVRADISRRDEVTSAFDCALNLLGGHVDIMVNCAGIQIRHPSQEFPMQDYDKVMAVNLDATFMFCQLAARDMMQRGYGKIVNIASMLSFFGGYTVPAYAASKGAVAQLTKAFANEWASRGINVNAIAPGYMDTKMNEALIFDPVRSAEIIYRIPQKRWGTGRDMAGALLFLCSPAADYVNGAILPVDGGYLGR